MARWHARRKFFDLTTSGKVPIAEEALRRIGELYDIEKAVRGKPPDVRKAARQHSSTPKVEALRLWLDDNLKRLPQKSRSDPIRTFPLEIALPLP